MLAASTPAPAQTPRDFPAGWKPVAEFFHAGEGIVARVVKGVLPLFR